MTTTTVFEYDEEKFTELLLYVAARLAGDPSNGSIKRNKILFFADALHYANYGKPITGATYVKHPLGPAPRGIRELEERLITQGEADLAVVQSRGRTQKMLFAKRPSNLRGFSGTEIAQVEAVIKDFADHTATELSELSHEMLGWQVALEREEIPYCSIFLYEGPVTESDILQAQSITERLRPELERAGVLDATAA